MINTNISGVGIPSECMWIIGEPFLQRFDESLKQKYGGTGLTLRLGFIFFYFYKI